MHIDELISRSLRGGLSAEESRRLESWRRASSENEHYYRELVLLLGEVTRAELGGVEPPPSAHDLIARAEAVQSGAPSGGRPRRVWSLVGLAAAAGIAAVMAIGGPSEAGFPLNPAVGEIVTARSETRLVNLGAGTVVLLGPESRFAVGASPDPSRVETRLDGRAFFVVARNEGRRFLVQTAAGTVAVRGTRFDLEARDDVLRVLVEEGLVELGSPGAAIEVAANQLGEVQGAEGPGRRDVDPAFVQRELSWVGTFVVLDNTPLDEAADELSRVYGVPVEVRDAALRQETVHGVFQNETLEEVLRLLCSTISARCTTSSAGATIGL